MLEPGGVICVTVPNEFSPLQIAGRAAVGAHDWWVAPPHHLNYFNFDSLTGLLTRSGFAARARTTSFPMEAFLMMGENYVERSGAGPRLPSSPQEIRSRFRGRGAKGNTARLLSRLAELGIGREAVVIAVKTP